jgi:hypothetical protein
MNDTGSYESDDFEESVERSTEQSEKVKAGAAKVQQSLQPAYEYAEDNSDFDDDDRYGVKDYLNESRESENLGRNEEGLDESGPDCSSTIVRHMLLLYLPS